MTTLWNCLLLVLHLVAASAELRLHVSKRLLPVLQEVVASASLDDPTTTSSFVWDFGDGSGSSRWTKVTWSNVTSSIASHVYGVAGDYVISVAAGDVTSASAPITVVEPISGVALEAKPNGAAAPEVPVSFVGRAARGSHVRFRFDFGDGSNRRDVAASRHAGLYSAYAACEHAFAREGAYDVSATASNPLGEAHFRLRYLVQTLPAELRFDRGHYVIERGHVTELSVSLGVSGTNVTFDWDFGDGGATIASAGSTVWHAYPSTGRFVVSVLARNEATTRSVPRSRWVTARTSVYVMHRLTGVTISFGSNTTGSRPVFAVGDPVTFEARLLPVEASGRGVFYVWSWAAGRRRQTVLAQMEHRFSEAGRYAMHVTANNYVSHVTSADALDCDVIERLGGVQRIQQRGGGSVLVNRSATYDAQYWFGSNVTHEWNFGDGSALVRLDGVKSAAHTYDRSGEFLVSARLSNALGSETITCRVFVLHERCDTPDVAVVAANQQVRQDEPIRLEAEVGAILCSASTTLTHVWNVTSGSFGAVGGRGRLLLLPPNALPPGDYDVRLEVRLVGTIVYATTSARLRILPVLPEVSVVGGAVRIVGRSEVLQLEGAVRFASTLRKFLHEEDAVRWSCVQPTRPDVGCFVVGADPLPASARFLVSTSAFHPHFTAFLFTFFYGNASADQLVQVDRTVPTRSSLKMALTCQTCRNRILFHRKLFLTVRCPGCSATVRFEWNVWHVIDDERSSSSFGNGGRKCFSAAGDTFYLNRTVSTGAPASTTTKVTVEPDHAPSGTVYDGWNGTVPIDPPWLSEGSPEVFSNWTSAFFGDATKAEAALEGEPGDTGSAPARTHANVLKNRGHDGGGSGSPVPPSVDKVLDFRGTDPRTEPHSLLRERELIHPDVAVTEGAREERFLLDRDRLLAGHTYLVVATAIDGDLPEVQASQQVTVAAGPVGGRCSVLPESGHELTTDFRLDCREWRPLVEGAGHVVLYQVSYSLSVDLPDVLVYFGLNHDFRFVLPAGLAEVNHQVLVDVVVWLSSGSSTPVCSIDRTVLPLPGHASDVRGLELAGAWFSNLTASLDRGESGLALNQMQVASSSLLVQSDVTSVAWRRTRLLKLLAKVELVTEAEAIQTLRVLSDLYSLPVPVWDVKVALRILRKSSRFFLSDSWDRCSFLCELGLAELARAVGSVLRKRNPMTSNWTMAFRSTVGLLERVVATQLSLEGPLPLQVTTKHLEVEFGCQASVAGVSMEPEVDQCFLVVTSAPLFPPRSDSVARFSRMTSLWTYACEDASSCGRSTLPATNVTIRTAPEEEPFGNGTGSLLKPRLMTIFQFASSGVATVVTLNFQRGEAEVSNVLVLVSERFPPSFRNYFRRQSFSLAQSGNTFSLFLGNLRGGATYHVAVTEDSRTSHHSDVEFSVDISEIECFRFDPTTSDWTASGCSAESSSGGIQCRCNSVSSYVARWSSLALQSRFTTLHGLAPNSLVPSLLALLLAAFLVLLYLTNRKQLGLPVGHSCRCSWLPDNDPDDRFVYWLAIQTGNCTDAGSTAKVYVMLHGELGTAGPRELTGSSSFRSGSANSFLVTSASGLGRILKVQLWHDNSGPNPSWFVEHVVVRDAATGSDWHFDCRRWLAVEEDGGKIEQELPPRDSWTLPEVFLSKLSFYRNALDWFPVFCFRPGSGGHFDSTDRLLVVFLAISASSELSYVWCHLDPLPGGLAVGLVAFFLQVALTAAFYHTELPTCRSESKGPDPPRGEPGTGSDHSGSRKVPKPEVDEVIEKLDLLQAWAETLWLRNRMEEPRGLEESSGSRGRLALQRSWASSVHVRNFLRAASTVSVVVLFVHGAWTGLWVSRDIGVTWLRTFVLGVATCSLLFVLVLSCLWSVVTTLWNCGQLLPHLAVCGCRCQEVVDRLPVTSAVASEEDFGRRVAARHRARQLRFSRPPTEAQLTKSRMAVLHERCCLAYFRELAGYVTVGLVLFGCFWSYSDPELYHTNDFWKRKFHRVFGSATTFSDWWQWFERDFLSVPSGDDAGPWFVGGTTSVVSGCISLTSGSSGNFSGTCLPRLREVLRQWMTSCRQSDCLADTRSLQVALDLFNVPTRVFSSIRFVFDLTGSLEPRLEVESVSASMDKWPSSLLTSVLEALLLVVLLAEVRSVLVRSLEASKKKPGKFHLIYKFVFLLLVTAYLSGCCLLRHEILKQLSDSGNLDSVVAWKRICSVLLGTLTALHLAYSVHFFRPWASGVRRALFFQASAFRQLLQLYVVVFVLMVAFCFVGTALLGTSGDNSDFRNPLVSFQSLARVLTGSYVGLTNVAAFWFYVSAFYLALAVVLAISVKAIARKQRHQVPPGSYQDLTISGMLGVLRNNLERKFRASETEGSAGSFPEISAEFVLAELEAQVDDMLFRTTQLCAYEGVRLKEEEEDLVSEEEEEEDQELQQCPQYASEEELKSGKGSEGGDDVPGGTAEILGQMEPGTSSPKTLVQLRSSSFVEEGSGLPYEEDWRTLPVHHKRVRRTKTRGKNLMEPFES